MAKAELKAGNPSATTGPLRLLIVEDTPSDAELMVAVLKRAGYSLAFEVVDSPQQFQQRVEQDAPDIILSDHNLRTWTGMDALEILQKLQRDIPFVVVTATLGDEAAVEYVKLGAADYVLKHRLDRLPVAVGRVLRERAQRKEAARLQEAILAAKRNWELTFDTVPDSVFVLDQDGRVERANRAAARTLGLEFSQLIGRRGYEVLHGRDEPLPGCPHCQLWRTGQESRGDIEEPRLGKVFDATCSPLRDPGGALSGSIVVLRDITERRKTEEFLRKLSSAVEQTADPVIVTDIQGTIEFVNPAFEKLTGFSSPEVLGKNPCILKSGLHPEDFFQKLWETILSGRPWRGIFVNRKKDGSTYFAETSIAPILSLEGKTTHFVSVEKDVTAHIQSEERLKQAERKYRMLFEKAPVMCATALNQGGVPLVSDCNELFAHTLGYERAELLGRPLSDVYAPSSRAAWLEGGGFQRALQGQSADEECELVSRDGRVVPTLLRSVPMAEKDGKVSGTQAMFVDLSARKRAEDALRMSEKRYRELFESATYGIYQSSLDGRFLDANPALVKMLGCASKEEVLGLNIATDVCVDPQERAQLIEQVLQRGQFHGTELLWKRKDGRRILVRLGGRDLKTQSGDPEGFEVFVEDVTERRSLEQQLRQSQKMQAIGQLAGGVAHDFNNLLGIIIGYSDLVLDATANDAVVQRRVQQVKDAAERAAALTRQLLAFSRQQVLAPTVLDLNSVLAESESLLRRLLPENIKLKVKRGEPLGRVKADRTQIEQVIMNLVVNARDAMAEGGTLLLETADMEFDQAYAQRHLGAVTGPHVMLAVSDTGMGMDTETQARIFEPFFTTKEKGKGTGLGLATVYGVVKQSGGFVWVYSEPGKGSTFKVYFPRVIADTEPAVAPRAETGDVSGTETILLVEDAESLRDLLCEAIRQRGYTVMEARDGANALEVAEQHGGPIHLLVSDVIMPGMSGRELAVRLKQSRPETRVLFISGYTSDAMGQNGLLDQGVAFLQKPFGAPALLSKLRRVLDAAKIVVS